MYKAIDIANWFIFKNRMIMEEYGSEKITLLKVLKLLYYAEGCYLAMYDKSLFNDEIVAWEHGPVVVEVYDHFPDAYNLELTDEDEDKVRNMPKDIRDFLGEVYNVFGQYTAWALRNKTHNEEPWIEATNGGTVLKRPISRETMKRYFKNNYVEE